MNLNLSDDEEYQDTFNEESYEFELGQYIYLLQEREFRKTKEKIYKLGKTKQQHTNRYSNIFKSFQNFSRYIKSTNQIMSKRTINQQNLKNY